MKVHHLYKGTCDAMRANPTMRITMSAAATEAGTDPHADVEACAKPNRPHIALLRP